MVDKLALLFIGISDELQLIEHKLEAIKLSDDGCLDLKSLGQEISAPYRLDQCMGVERGRKVLKRYILYKYIYKVMNEVSFKKWYS